MKPAYIQEMSLLAGRLFAFAAVVIAARAAKPRALEASQRGLLGRRRGKTRKRMFGGFAERSEDIRRERQQ